jgi:hypothetical protein
VSDRSGVSIDESRKLRKFEETFRTQGLDRKLITSNYSACSLSLRREKFCDACGHGADVSVIRPEHVHLFGKRHSALALLIGAVILTGRTTYHLNML